MSFPGCGRGEGCAPALWIGLLAEASLALPLALLAPGAQQQRLEHAACPLVVVEQLQMGLGGRALPHRHLRRPRTLLTPAPPSPPASLFLRMFETFSFLPPLSDSEIAKQVDYIVNNGWSE